MSLLCILYITLFSRTPSLTRVAHLIPLWSVSSPGHWKQLLLNVCLFIPLGYFLASIYPSSSWRFVLVIALALSAGIELTQFLTYRGMLDVDDLISNCLGAGIGIFIHVVIENHKQHGLAEKWMSGVLLLASIFGCIVVAVPAAGKTTYDKTTEQYDFRIATIKSSGEEMKLEGICEAYERSTPSYTLLLGGAPIPTTVNGNDFIATATVLAEKAELQIRFKGYNVMPTGIWLNPVEDGVRIEYVPGDVTEPEGVPDTAILKAYSPDFDTFVFQNGRELLWFIGWDGLDSDTEIIYHLRTNTPELLPENRVRSGFDNRGFRVKAGEAGAKEIKGNDHYRVFEDIIPDQYNVTAIVVGFNTEGNITWSDSFRVN